MCTNFWVCTETTLRLDELYRGEGQSRFGHDKTSQGNMKIHKCFGGWLNEWFTKVNVVWNSKDNVVKN